MYDLYCFLIQKTTVETVLVANSQILKWFEMQRTNGLKKVTIRTQAKRAKRGRQSINREPTEINKHSNEISNVFTVDSTCSRKRIAPQSDEILRLNNWPVFDTPAR